MLNFVEPYRKLIYSVCIRFAERFVYKILLQLTRKREFCKKFSLIFKRVLKTISKNCMRALLENLAILCHRVGRRNKSFRQHSFSTAYRSTSSSNRNIMSCRSLVNKKKIFFIIKKICYFIFLN